MNLATISADSNAVVVFCSLKNRYSYNVASYIFLNDILPIPYFTMGTDNTLLIVNSCNIVKDKFAFLRDTQAAGWSHCT